MLFLFLLWLSSRFEKYLPKKLRQQILLLKSKGVKLPFFSFLNRKLHTAGRS
jgi:hypothetical protein